jgi:hypothetical protein
MKEWNQYSLLSRKEAAAFLGVKENTLAVWTCTKRYNIPVIKVGRLVRYRFPDLLVFLGNRTINEPTGEGMKGVRAPYHNR